jgi:hypothetical protein
VAISVSRRTSVDPYALRAQGKPCGTALSATLLGAFMTPNAVRWVNHKALSRNRLGLSNFVLPGKNGLGGIIKQAVEEVLGRCPESCPWEFQFTRRLASVSHCSAVASDMSRGVRPEIEVQGSSAPA